RKVPQPLGPGLARWIGRLIARAARVVRRVRLAGGRATGVSAPDRTVAARCGNSRQEGPRRHTAGAAARSARSAQAAPALCLGLDDRRLRDDRPDSRLASIALLRDRLPSDVVTSRDLHTLEHSSRVRMGGLVVARQLPGTA